MAEHALTDEQQEAVRLFATGEHLVIEAGAGAGKTSTLVAIAEQAATEGRQGFYTAFNRAIVVDSARRFPTNITAATIHSVAHNAIMAERPDLRPRMNTKRHKRSFEAQLLGTEPQWVHNTPVGTKRLAAGFLVGYVLDGVNRWCQTADPEPEAKHLPTIEVLDQAGKFGHRGPNNWALAEMHVEHMKRAWVELIKPGGQLRFGHPHYLKMFELSRPHIPADFILFDEAQDVSGVMRSIVFQQMERGTQIVAVGDRAQELYGYLGASNAMERLKDATGARQATLTQSFRFGPALADVANRILGMMSDNDMQISGFDKIPTVIESAPEPDCIIVRTNALAVTRALQLMRDGRKVAIAKSLRDQVVGFAKGAMDLRDNGWTPHPELTPFASWGEVHEFVMQDVAGSELALMVRLVDEFTPEAIIAELDAAVSEERADVTITTAHTSKGREWDRVQLGKDFPQADPDTGLPPMLGDDEARVLYVAATRAKLVLDLDQVGWLAPRKDTP